MTPVAPRVISRGSEACTPPAVGLGFEVLVQVTMDREDASTITEFEHRLAAIPEVRHAERLFGDPDYLVRVAATARPDPAIFKAACVSSLRGGRSCRA